MNRDLNVYYKAVHIPEEKRLDSLIGMEQRQKDRLAYILITLDIRLRSGP